MLITTTDDFSGQWQGNIKNYFHDDTYHLLDNSNTESGTDKDIKGYYYNTQDPVKLELDVFLQLIKITEARTNFDSMRGSKGMYVLIFNLIY